MERPKERRLAEAFIVEGVRLCEEALQAGWRARLVLYSGDLSERGQAVVSGFAAQGVEVEQVETSLLQRISATETSQGILAVVTQQPLQLPEAPDYILVIDGIRDPGNLGTILRTATAAGVQAVLLLPGTVDVYAPKVVRSAMGAHFKLPLQVMDWMQLRAYLAGSQAVLLPRVYLADAGGEWIYTQVDFRRPLALILGGEADGASRDAHALAHARVRIPMPGAVESLNAAVAAGILMFEVVRQRAG